MTYQYHPYPLPTLTIGFNDLSVLRNVIRGYLAYSRRISLPTQERQEQAHLLEGIFQRLIGAPHGAMEVHIHLQIQEIHALNTAMLGFCARGEAICQDRRQRSPGSALREKPLRCLPRRLSFRLSKRHPSSATRAPSTPKGRVGASIRTARWPAQQR